MDEEWDDDDISDGWSDEDDEIDLTPCPNCGELVYEDSEQCPSCGDYIVHDHSVWTDKPSWWILLGVAGIIAVILVLSGLVF